MSIEPYKFCSCCPLLASPKSMKPLLQLAGTWGKYKSAKYLAFQGKRQMAMECPTLEMEFLFNTSCGRFDCLGWNTSTWISDQIWSVWWSANKTKLLWVAATIPHIYPIFSTISPDFSTKRIPYTSYPPYRRLHPATQDPQFLCCLETRHSEPLHLISTGRVQPSNKGGALRSLW